MNEKVQEAVDKIERRPEIRITFLGPTSAEADIHIDGVNEIQIFGAAKLIEQAGMEHLARRAMEAQIAEAQKRGGLLVPPTKGIQS